MGGGAVGIYASQVCGVCVCLIAFNAVGSLIRFLNAELISLPQELLRLNIYLLKVIFIHSFVTAQLKVDSQWR